MSASRPIAVRWFAAAALMLFVACGGQAKSDVGTTGTVGTGGRAEADAGGDGSGSGTAHAGGTASGSGGAGGVANPAEPLTSSGGTFLLARDFDQSCDSDDDCARVTEGFQCGCFECVNSAAIATTELDRWNELSIVTQCPRRMPCFPISDAPDCSATPACHAGQCIARQPPGDVLDTHYDRMCSSDLDCVAIRTGGLCSECPCGAGAVSRLGAEQLAGDRSRAACEPLARCDCPPLPEVHCYVPLGPNGVCRPGPTP